jgi:hypothetical protein
MMEQRREQSRKELAAILSDAQMKRLDEISIQLRGVRAVLDPEVQKGIGLTEDQNVKIRDLMQKMQEANRSLMEKARNEEITREDAMAARENNEKALEVELNKLLSQTQKSKLKDLSGKPFQAEPQQFQRGSGRRPGRG